MTSAINPAYPATGNAYTANVRDNFSAAKSEIEALQTSVSNLTDLLFTVDAYYIDPVTGDDGNAGTAAEPLATIAEALTRWSTQFPIYPELALHLADATYSEALTLNAPMPGGATLAVVGNATSPQNVIISPATDIPVNINNGATCSLSGLTTAPTTGQTGIYSDTNATLAIGASVRLGADSGFPITCENGATISFTASTAFIGTPQNLFLAGHGGLIIAQGYEYTIPSGTAFGAAAAIAYVGGIISLADASFSGSATGTRYICQSNGIVDTGDAGPTFLPGDASGTTSTGGQYV